MRAWLTASLLALVACESAYSPAAVQLVDDGNRPAPSPTAIEVLPDAGAPVDATTIEAGVDAGPERPPGPFRMWPVGDSLTIGKGPPAGGCGYRDPLAVALEDAGIGAVFVGTQRGGEAVSICPVTGVALAHDGTSGYKSAQLSAHVSSWYRALAPPDGTLLHIGTNDVIAVQNGTMTIEQAIADFNTLTAGMLGLDPKMTLFVSTLLNLPGISPDVTEAFNANVVAQAEQYRAAGRRVVLVDMFTVTNGLKQPAPDADFNDGGIHLVTGGYGKMAGAWFDAISAAVNQPAKR